jgi:acyl carrier protein
MIQTMDNLEKYNQVFISNFKVTKDQLESLEFQSVSVWDSIGHMSLIAALEEAFNINVEPDDILSFSSYRNGKQILKKYNLDL